MNKKDVKAQGIDQSQTELNKQNLVGEKVH